MRVSTRPRREAGLGHTELMDIRYRTGRRVCRAMLSFSVSGESSYTWAASTSDVRALQNPGGSGRMASLWFNAPSFTMDVNLKDGNTHQVALYALDWDNYEGGRAEQIQVKDASTDNGAGHAQRDQFSERAILVWNITGHVKIVVTTTNANANAAISGFSSKVPLIGVSVTPQSASITGGQTSSIPRR